MSHGFDLDHTRSPFTMRSGGLKLLDPVGERGFLTKFLAQHGEGPTTTAGNSRRRRGSR